MNLTYLSGYAIIDLERVYMFRKIKKLCSIIKYFFEDEDNLLLHLMEIKAYESLEDCVTLEVRMTEEIEDLIFHIKTYYDIPESIAETRYPEMKDIDIPWLIKEYKSGKLDMRDVMRFADYMGEVETQRALERDIIFDHAKNLAFGFKL